MKSLPRVVTVARQSKPSPKQNPNNTHAQVRHHQTEDKQKAKKERNKRDKEKKKELRKQKKEVRRREVQLRDELWLAERRAQGQV